VALRRGQLRVSPHLYNTEADIDRALEVLGGRVAPVESG
jgi:selenocysteine lyase/cysteine desulfurase